VAYGYGDIAWLRGLEIRCISFCLSLAEYKVITVQTGMSFGVLPNSTLSYSQDSNDGIDLDVGSVENPSELSLFSTSQNLRYEIVCYQGL
jgi:hypothetical protein